MSKHNSDRSIVRIAYELGVCGDVPGENHKRRPVSDAFPIALQRLVGRRGEAELTQHTRSSTHLCVQQTEKTLTTTDNEASKTNANPKKSDVQMKAVSEDTVWISGE